jgi:hypothetical protein
MASKPTLSREYLYVPFAQMNMPIATLSLSKLAFKTAGVEPLDADWKTAIPVTVGHAIYVASIGDSLAILVGPLRADAGVTTNDLPAGDYQVWVDARTTGSDERIVRVAGVLTITATGS